MVTSTCPLSEVARAKNDLAGATNASVRLVGVPAEGPDRAPSRRNVRATPGCGPRQLVSVDDFLQRLARGVWRLRRLREEEKEQRSPPDALFHREIPEADRTVLAKELVEGDQLVAVQRNHAERNGPTARRARAGDDEPYVSARRQEGRHVQSGAQRAGTDRAAASTCICCSWRGSYAGASTTGIKSRSE